LIVLGVVSATATGPFPATSGVTSRASHAPAAKLPERTTGAAAASGAEACVSVASSNDGSATARTSKPVADPDRA
jgi:hypothetical protein